ncbi:C2 family cysteine protease [Antribacter sp. KLBMP9083]|uniref:C2 family cysteine protease n=1 Tax=Antribacter soli TaxID=2910976 RepID=A0AA41QBE9_9MICO|nr:C2 family cysteine protease [Antribacter soli]MCF4120349.1 C2 family cysteine protease [Antribacter soli]
MSGMYGADVAQLRALGETMARGAETLESMLGQVGSQVVAAPWFGPSGDQFVEEWHSQHASSLRGAIAALEDAGRKAIANADAQERTSNELDGGGGGRGDGGYVSPDPSRGSGGDPSGGPGNKEKEPEGGGDLGKPEDIGQVPTDDAAINPNQIDQGSLADCWFLASAGAVAKQDPEWLREHMRYNAQDGTYTVTFYRDGEPVEITVEANVMSDAAGDPSGNPSWISVYEKAAAVFMGGEYGDIEYDDPATALEMITGKETDSADTDPFLPWSDPPSFSSIQDQLDSGKPVVASSKDGGGWFGDGPSDDEVVANHVYVVDGVSADGKTITLINPWGPSGGTGSDGNTKPGTITMTADEFYENFGSVTTGSSTRD